MKSLSRSQPALVRRIVASAAVLAIALPMMSACTGDGQVAAFTRAFASDPDIQSMELTSHDNQPFTGGISGEVVARDGLTDTDVAALFDRLSEYTIEHGAQMLGRVSLDVDGIEAIIAGDEDEDADSLADVLTLRGDDRVRSAELEAAFVALVCADAAAAVSLLRDSPLPLRTVEGEPGSTMLIRSDDGSVDVLGTATERASTLAIWDRLRAVVPLSGVRLRERDLVVTLALERDHDRARSRVEEMSPAADVEVRFASDVVRLGESDGSLARELLGSLDPRMTSRVAFVWESDTRLEITLRSADEMDVVINALTEALPPRATAAAVEVEAANDTRVELLPG